MSTPIGFDMTPATRALDAAGVVYSTHVFEHDPAVRDYGREAADAIGADHDQVFKTLVVVVDGALAVAILPVSCQLSMKFAAATITQKMLIVRPVFSVAWFAAAAAWPNPAATA